MQVLQRAPLVSLEAKRRLEAYFSQDAEVHDAQGLDDENLAVAAPEAAGFESQLQGIIDMLQGLATKFEDERTQLEKQEAESKHAFEMLSMDLHTQLDAARDARTEKAEAKADALQQAADGKGALADVTSTRDDDSRYLADVTATCELKASAFAERQKTRAGEIEAIKKAVDILSGGAVSGASQKHLPQLMQMNGSSLAQLREVSGSPAQAQVVFYLKDQARHT